MRNIGITANVFCVYHEMFKDNNQNNHNRPLKEKVNIQMGVSIVNVRRN